MPATTNIQAIPYPIGTEVVGKAPSEVFQPMVGAIETRLNMRFSTTAARDAAIPSPVEGMECFVNGTKYLYRGDQWNITNTGWQTWTPTLTNVTLGTGGTANGRYQIINGMAHYSAHITLGTSGALTGGFGMTLPTNRRTDAPYDIIGNAWLRDTSAGTNRAWVFYGSSATGGAILSPDGSFVNASGPWTWAAGDTITIRGSYEAAP